MALDTRGSLYARGEVEVALRGVADERRAETSSWP